MMAEKVKQNLFLSIAVVYLFFNSCALPHGLLYTTFIAPILLLFLLNHSGIKTYLAFLLGTVLFAVIHFYNGISNAQDYIKSFLMLQSVGVFAIYSYYTIPNYLMRANTFKILASVNLILLIFSIIIRFIPSLMGYMWYMVPISPGIPVVPRLMMFTYEASYYSLILAPVLIYYLLGNTINRNRVGLLLLSLILSLILSFSLGVLAAIIMAGTGVLIWHWPKLKNRFALRKIYIFLGIVSLIALTYNVMHPNNVVSQRIQNIWLGKDTSARGRTYEAFELAWNIAKTKSTTWGIGLGQLKSIGRDYIVQYYHYANIPDTVRIPNAVAETLNIYGIVGIIIRFGLIFLLFFKTRVYQNYYCLFLFLFMFIYQFTGSYISNLAEYMIWVLAFSPSVFAQFNVSKNNRCL